jgi:23S rRNA U2552 (ribose-2'-O)-methylase RlmE/FtsJ
MQSFIIFLLCSDMAPLSTGNKKLDHTKIIVSSVIYSNGFPNYKLICTLPVSCFDQDLNRSALEFAKTVLVDGGSFLCKLWDGNETEGLFVLVNKRVQSTRHYNLSAVKLVTVFVDLMEEISQSFLQCKQVKPKASRMDSSELYIFAKGFVKK